ncbi:MAG: FkbM family methyltransferase, partial [Patescibacteria group bacterium]|nr:FkbM family methyltransferase [Patescibacteria group bacterium]
RFRAIVRSCTSGLFPNGRMLSNAVIKQQRPYRVRVRVAGNARTMLLSGNSADLWTLYEVFARNTYETGAEDPKRVVDLGANIGISVMWFRLRYPDARIVAYEPNPASFAMLRKNFADDPQVELHEEAVAGVRGTLTFHVDTESSPSSSLVHKTERTKDVQVRAVTLDDALAGGADLLKIDIEGAEFDALASSEKVREIPIVTGEVYPGMAGKREEDVERLLANLSKAHVVVRGKGSDARTFTAVQRAQ